MDFWTRIESETLAEKAVREQWDDRKLREHCTYQTDGGGRYFRLGEYKILLTQIDKVRYLSK